MQVSDIHVSPAFDMPASFDSLRSYPCVSTLRDLGPMEMEPYGVTAPAPSFILGTGDIAEFSFPGVTWQVVDKYFEGVKQPIYMIPGNHDNTWVADPGEFRRRFGGMNYSFDYEGCHFIGLCSATLQDPSPSFGEEAIRFLRKDLAGVGTSKPVFIFYHHPLNGGEFASRYDVDRLLDVIRPYNVVLTFDGHGHAAVRHDFYRLDGVEGGSPFAKTAGNEGYNIVSVGGDMVRVAYRKCGEAAAKKGLIEKKMPTRSDYSAIQIQSPYAFQEMEGASLKVMARIEGAPRPIASGRYSLDDESEGELTFSNGEAVGTVDLSGAVNGAHFLRVVFVDDQGGEYTRTHAFFVEAKKGKGAGRALWRRQLGGGSKATPLVHDGVVYLGSNDGRFHALDAKTGIEKWGFDAGAEILTSAAVHDGLVLFGAGDGRFYALDTKGRIRWTYSTDNAIFSSPVVDSKSGSVFFGTNSARLVALGAADGKELWVNSDARFSVESKPCVKNGVVYFGAWDGYVYGVDAKSGKTMWKTPGPKNQERVITYYGPADDGPAATSSGSVFICDRGYVAGKYTSGGQFVDKISTDCWALSMAEDEKALYLRGMKEPVQKVDLNGATIWKTGVVGGRIPVGPTAKGGKVYVCTNTGHLNVFDDKTGAALWEYQVSPKLYVMAGVGVDKRGVAYTVGMDGYVTAIAGPAAE